MKQAMILAAGLGTRLRPLTDTLPKALVPVAGQPLLWHQIAKLRAAGFRRIVVNVHHFASQIIDYLHANQSFGLDISVSNESGLLLETGGGLKKALPLFQPDSPILIHNVDILSNIDLAALYSDAVQGRADALLVVSPRTTKRYLLFDEGLRLHGWTNTETGQLRPDGLATADGLAKWAFSGIHVLCPGAFPLMQSWPERFPIIDFYLSHCAEARICGVLKNDLRLMDVGKIDTLEQAEQFIHNIS